jgi:hypothetical protein
MNSLKELCQDVLAFVGDQFLAGNTQRIDAHPTRYLPDHKFSYSPTSETGIFSPPSYLDTVQGHFRYFEDDQRYFLRQITPRTAERLRQTIEAENQALLAQPPE